MNIVFSSFAKNIKREEEGFIQFSSTLKSQRSVLKNTEWNSHKPSSVVTANILLYLSQPSLLKRLQKETGTFNSSLLSYVSAQAISWTFLIFMSTSSPNLPSILILKKVQQSTSPFSSITTKSLTLWLVVQGPYPVRFSSTVLFASRINKLPKVKTTRLFSIG